MQKKQQNLPRTGKQTKIALDRRNLENRHAMSLKVIIGHWLTSVTKEVTNIVSMSTGTTESMFKSIYDHTSLVLCEPLEGDVMR